MFLVAVTGSIDIALESINKITNNEKFEELKEELFKQIQPNDNDVNELPF